MAGEATVWKFVFRDGHDRVIFEMPRGAEVLFVTNQQEQLCLWARVDPRAEKEPRPFAVVMTGGPAPTPEQGRYIGTALLHGGALVLHVFEPVNKNTALI